MKPRIRLTIFSLLLLFTLFVAPAVSAHPLGNFTINHFDGIHVAAQKISIDYVLDMAEIPAFQEMSLIARGPDGKPDPAALPGYAAQHCQSIAADLILQEDGRVAALTPTRSTVTFPVGAAGLSTLRLTCGFQSAGLAYASDERIDFTDNSYAGRIGWREIVVFAEGIPLQGDFATQSISKELTAYPQDMLSSPLDERQVSLKVGTLAGSSLQSPAGKPASPSTALWFAGARSDQFTQLITLQEFTPTSILLALLIAFIWGGLHSLTPGHGKTIVGAYLVGNRGTALHALYLGLMTTLTHTAGVFLLGLVTLFASRYILPDQLFPWISVLSGVLVVGIGVVLFIGRLRATRVWAGLLSRFDKRAHLPVANRSAPAFNFSTASAEPGTLQIRLNSILPAAHPLVGDPMHALTLAVHHHADGSVHTHTAGEHVHSHAPAEHVHPHAAGEHTHSHAGISHTHNANLPGGHTHLPPGADGNKVTLRSLLALGISGGLLPCPSALVVMLGAIALNRIAFGIVLVLVFSLGLASVLTAIGLAMVYARRFFEKLPVHSRFMELIPAGSALFIMVLGAGITLQALIQLGLIVI
jgi:nickel/cobalt exporter